MLARQSALISNSKTTKKIFVPEDCLLWLLCCFFLFVFEQKSGSGGTITGLALLTACRCIVFGIPLLALGRNWIAVMWCWVRAEWFRLFSAAFVYWGRLGVNINRLCSRGGLDWEDRWTWDDEPERSGLNSDWFTERFVFRIVCVLFVFTLYISPQCNAHK